MAHEKLKSLVVMVAIFASVGAISWAIVNSHAHAEVFPSEKNPNTTTENVNADLQEMTPLQVNFLEHRESIAETGGNFAQ